MNCYFEEGEVFTWIRDRERSGENMVVSLKMLKECHRTGSKQAMIAEDIRTGKKYFVKVLFCNDLEQVYVEKESKVQLYSPYIIRIYGGMLDEKNKRFITLVEYIEESDLSELMRGRGIAGDTWNEKMKVRNRIAMKFLLGIENRKERQDMPIQDIGTVISAGRRWIFILPDLYFILFIQGSIISMEMMR